MASFQDSFRAWRRNFKAMLPYVRRREHRILRQRHDQLIESLAWTAPPAIQARLHMLKPLASNLEGEVCFFVSFASRPGLKRHVRVHIEHLRRAGVRVVLVLNTDLPPGQMQLGKGLLDQLSGAYVRENIGFDFAAWAHLYSLCAEQAPRWARLFLINDSIVGPLNALDFDRMMQRVRGSGADVLGLTECRLPLRHVQSFFLVLNTTALRHTAMHQFFRRMLSLPDKGQVIDVYETRLTQMLAGYGLRCESLFPPLADDEHSSNDISLRWAQLIRAGFPYIKASILARHAASAQVKSLVPVELISPDD